MKMNFNSLRLVIRLVSVVVVSALLVGCNVVLYSNLDESDVNEIIAVLARHDIDSSKNHGRGDRLSVEVAKADVAAAVDVLRQSGLPRKRFDNIGELFSKQGLISSPLEERARFVYAMQETLQETLSQIDGVMVARVHIVLPENNPFGKDGDKVSSASVFIKHSPEFDLGSLRSEMKMVVGNGIQGLSYKDVTVTLVPAAVPVAAQSGLPIPPAAGSPGFGSSATTVGFWLLFFFGLVWLAGSRLGARVGANIDPEQPPSDAPRP